ncbi:uncharacterized protein LOC124607563 [Schistocerca americana]|uniref:uncharacterized protein LOC124607563 n=1 Tax=Schistocerca americana TaxID=7009 RepID=UPI001F4F3F6F|nr:uncharacterized protein LOC124607563 [Schistocerca americana]
MSIDKGKNYSKVYGLSLMKREEKCYITVADELIRQNKTNAVSKLLNPQLTNHTLVFIPTIDTKQLKIKHSSGLDGVTSHLIKECRECILKPSTHMLNAAIEEGIFPDSLKYSILHPSQHGFREGKSTKTASTDIIEHFLNLLDRQQKTFAIFMDLSKAFDFVNHLKLMMKLYQYGIRGKCYDILKSYITNRKQCTKIRHTSEGNIANYTSE